MKTFREHSPTGWRERVSRRAVLILALAFLALSPRTLAAGQDVALDAAVGHDVYGNGALADGYDAPTPGDPSTLTLSPDENSVRAAGDVAVSGDIYGAALASASTVSVEDNRVSADGGKMSGVGIFGGYSDSSSGASTAVGNRVSAESGGALEASFYIYGGYAKTYDGVTKAQGNLVVAAGGGGAARSLSRSIYGGYAQSFVGAVQAAGNRVVAEDGGLVSANYSDGAIYGGVARSTSGAAQADGNRVAAEDGGLVSANGARGIIYGGLADSYYAAAQANGNRVAAEGGGLVSATDSDGIIYGGYAQSPSAAQADGNRIAAEDGGSVSSGANIYGGFAYTNSGAAQTDGNQIAARGGSVAANGSGGAIYGGYARSLSGAVQAAGNRVAAEGDGSVAANGTIYGGYAESFSGAAQADGNRIDAGGGAVTSGSRIYGGYAKSSSGAAQADGNQIAATAGSVTAVGQIYAGYASGYISATASANLVAISGGAISGAVYGGSADASVDATASANLVAISGGVVSGGIFGGAANSLIGSSAASNNRVEISGAAIISGDIIGGGVSTISGSAVAHDNRVDVSGTPDLSAASLYGGYQYAGNGDVFTGNVLNLKASGLTAAGLANFEFLNFHPPASVRAEDVILKVNGVASLQDPDNISRTSTVAMSAIPGAAARLNSGDRIVLIDATSLLGSPANDTVTVAQGVTLTHDFRLDASGNQLVATLAGTEVSAGSVALSEGFLAGLAFVNTGADLVAGQGTRDAARAARESLSPSMGIATFMTLSGGSSRYNTGSHVDARGLSLLAGLAWGRDIEPGRLTLGAFFEYGEGNFDTFNSFPNAPSLRGEGDARHIGGGILASADIAQVGPGTLRAEASVRAGRIHVSFRSPDLVDPWGLAAEYDASSAYYGASLGLGFEWNLTDKTSLDFYGQYFWTRQGGDNVVLSTGDPVTFEDADSSRLHLGTRLSRAFSERVSARVGAAYERELAGAARASVHGHSFRAPSLKGGTGVGELGLAIAPTAGLPLLTLDLSLQGYAGKREGWSGNMAVKLEF
ncbi:MAG: hypothetical protein LBO66_09830 [Deltaproteobacteria bacterium]|jgi:hypothetical protein|nr:hypothetical protein [Deltaproteobacteria bacterium]